MLPSTLYIKGDEIELGRVKGNRPRHPLYTMPHLAFPMWASLWLWHIFNIYNHYITCKHFTLIVIVLKQICHARCPKRKWTSNGTSFKKGYTNREIRAEEEIPSTLIHCIHKNKNSWFVLIYFGLLLIILVEEGVDCNGALEMDKNRTKAFAKSFIPMYYVYLETGVRLLSTFLRDL